MSNEIAATEGRPHASRNRWAYRIALVFLAAVVIPVGATVVYHFPPSKYPYYPPCFFNKLTGFHCPGCGATRCVGALVRGDLAQAFAYNPLFTFLLPYVGYTGLRTV